MSRHSAVSKHDSATHCLRTAVSNASVMILVVVVAFSSLARILGECSIIHFPPAFFLSGDWLVHTYSTLYARISPQWLSKLRRLWSNVS